MRKKLLVLVIAVTMMLSACSFIGDVNNTIEYINRVKEHVNTLNRFAEDAPQMFQDAVLNSEVKEELENKMTTLLEDIEKFNNSEVPAIAEEIHQQLVEKNNLLEEEIKKMLESGEYSIAIFEGSSIVGSIDDITSLLKQIEELGN